MSRAIQLARKGLGHTSPNPIVGACVVKSGEIVGEGYHKKAGTPHAEIHAIKMAGSRASGADLYVTLEPCCHEGRTPPCCPSIIEAGIRRVIIGTIDPNPKVSGRGVKLLKSAQVDVVIGVLEDECSKLNKPYNKYITTGMPYGVLKVAVSLDGKIATANGESKWITNESCRGYVHKLRSQVDAVMVGAGTVKNDNPSLDVRLKNYAGRQPIAIVVDENISILRKSKLFKRKLGQLIVVTTKTASKKNIRWVQDLGHRVIICKAKNGLFDLRHMMKELGRLEIVSVLIEGGGQLFASLFKERLIDRMVVCIAPKFIGGQGKDFLPDIKILKMRDVAVLKDVNIVQFGDNAVIEGDF